MSITLYMVKRMVFRINIPLSLWKEGESIVAYTPALELSTFGTTEEDALEKFSEAVELFFETAEERNVTVDLLESLGWEYHKSTLIPNSSPLDGARFFPLEIALPETVF
jgi:predicted RNase H-like HicB family nuclease